MASPPSPNSNSDSGCFSAMLHRLLCMNGVPTHPSLELDHASAPHSKKKTKSLVLADQSYKTSSPPLVSSSAQKPGIVARLMGLETLPDFTRRVDPRMKSTPGTVPRSYSVNFMDHLITGVDPLGHVTLHPHHRRVRTSVSFREVVVPRHQSQQDDLLVLYPDELTMADQSSKVEANSSSSSCNSKGSKNEVLRAGKEFKMKKDHKLRDHKRTGCGVVGGKEKVVISKLRKETSARPVRGQQSSSVRVTDDGTRRNYKLEISEYNGKDGKQRAAGRRIQEKEVVAESNFITKKRKQRRSGNNRKLVVPDRLKEEIKEDSSERHISRHDLDPCGYYRSQRNYIPEDMKSYLRNLSSTEGAKERKRDSDKLDTQETHDEGLVIGSALDLVCRLTEEDIIHSTYGNKQKAFELSSALEEICVKIEQRILNIVVEQMVGDLI